MQTQKAQYQGVQPMQSLVGLKVIEMPAATNVEGFEIRFVGAYIKGYCSHYFLPETFKSENLIESSIVLVGEDEGRFEIVFDCGGTLIIDPAPDSLDSPEAFTYRNENYEPPLVVVCHKRVE